MRLERVSVQNYKCLQDITIDFRKPEGEKDIFSAQLLVGVNGSGKSCFLEALGLIFSRIMQGEVPGFPFELWYRIKKDQVQVRVRPARSSGRAYGKLEVLVTVDGQTKRMTKVPPEYLPRRIVACSSGTNHLMELVLLSSPRASLASDLYDLTLRDGTVDGEEMAQLLEQYRELDTNPRMFSVDGETAKLIVPVLFAVIPNFRNHLLAKDYFELRGYLTGRVSEKFKPVAFSVTVDETLLQRAIEERYNSPQYSLLAKLLRPEQPDGGGPLHDWVVRRPLLPEGDMLDGEAAEQMSQTAVFCYEPWRECGEGGWMWSRPLSEEFGGDPMALLNVLIAAKRGNILRDIQCAFRVGDQPTLMGLETLSDGELMWLARMGLVLMSKMEGSAETLFLFDEPDVHFNNEWNEDFIHTLHRASALRESGLYHEFVIATHSTLLLTDAYPEQIHLFSASRQGEVRVDNTPIASFATQQDELSRRLFSASAVGRYAMKRIDCLLQQAQTPEELEELIQQTGPGFQRFRLYERYFELKRERDQ